MKIRIYGKKLQKMSYLIAITLSTLLITSGSFASPSQWPYPGDIFDWGGNGPAYYTETLNITKQNLFKIISGLRMALENRKLRAREPKFSIQVHNWHEGQFVGIEINVCETEYSISDKDSHCLAVRFSRR